MNINSLILNYSRANLQVDGIYRLSIPLGSKALKQTTMKGVCGFVFPISGKAKFTVCGEEYLLEKGTILHAGANMELSKEVIGNDDWEFILMHYKVLNEDDMAKSLLHTHYILKIFTDHNRDIMQLLERMMINQRSSGVINSLKSKSILYEIISETLDFSKERDNCKNDDPIEKALNYIHGNMDKNILITELAEQFGMDGKQFYYLFQKKVGKCPKKYLIESRIKRAKELLSEDSYSITDISNMIGYEDPLNFSRMFKKSTGIAPSMFRNQFGKNPY